MVLVTPEEFIPKLKALFSEEIKGVKGAVTVQEKSIPSEKVGKHLRDKAVAAGPSVWLIRAFKNGNNRHKIKISTAVTVSENSEFQAKLAAVMKAEKQRSAPKKKNKRHGKANQE
ncbi:unnamed protein product [Aphanomyces euteiches]|uniref:Signal recognition particle 14 kDa protein n=1 Tax=Aphanomyces euteiches TaxID=100861 RepID=A0A6G0XJA5_9STRA|nr:hypothetical protein Ae201684_004244 [Aphanomyces euteiches]KAH9140062.1 hypothetical protein AeRB84_015669 [Aphanomyces euteiches]